MIREGDPKVYLTFDASENFILIPKTWTGEVNPKSKHLLLSSNTYISRY